MRRTILVCGALLATAVLGGCASVTSDPGHSGSPTGASPSPSSSTEAFLLRVTATLQFGDGTVVHLIETADAPVVGDGSELETMATVGECEPNGDTGLQARFPSPQWVHIGLTTRYESGDALPEDELVAVLGGNGWGDVAWTGAWHHGQAYCASGYADIPGMAEGLAPVEATAAIGDKTSWSGARWGFSLDHEREAPPSMSMTFSECRIEFGAGAAAATDVLAREPAYDGFPQDCIFGRS